MNIYALNKKMEYLQSLLEENIDEEVFADVFEAIDGEIDETLENFAKMCKNLEKDIAAFDKEAKRLQEKKKMLENNVTRTKQAMLSLLKTSGKKSVKGEVFTISVRKNGGAKPLVINKEMEIPESFLKISYKEDTSKIRKALEEGQVLDFAYLQERGESLVIS